MRACVRVCVFSSVGFSQTMSELSSAVFGFYVSEKLSKFLNLFTAPACKTSML